LLLELLARGIRELLELLACTNPCCGNPATDDMKAAINFISFG